MNTFLRCLVEMDVAAVRELWPVVAPGKPIASDYEALTIIHYARTQSESVPHNMRTYSHRWLCERGLPSGLRDETVRTSEAVGISVKAMSEASVPLARAIEQAMTDAVAEAYADGRREPEFVKARMGEARARVMKC
jgi:hypothetical protein